MSVWFTMAKADASGASSRTQQAAQNTKEYRLAQTDHLHDGEFGIADQFLAQHCDAIVFSIKNQALVLQVEVVLHGLQRLAHCRFLARQQAQWPQVDRRRVSAMRRPEVLNPAARAELPADGRWHRRGFGIGISEAGGADPEPAQLRVRIQTKGIAYQRNWSNSCCERAGHGRSPVPGGHVLK